MWPIARPGKKAHGDDKNGDARLEARESRVNASQTQAEIGDTDLVLEWARGPTDGRRRLLGEEHMAEKGPQTHNSERKQEQIAQQPVDDEVPPDRPRFTRDRDPRKGERRDPQQQRNEPGL